jgi:class I fructose-bisphosphate aldolase
LTIETNFKKLFTKNKTLILAYDHGMEHGPRDFNLKNCNPEFIFDLAIKGKFNAIAVGHGIAEKYYPKYKSKIPLIVKVNGHSSLSKPEPNSPLLCSVERAKKLGASAIGFTVHAGSFREQEMLQVFSKLVEDAHNQNLPVIMWAYPRGNFIKNDMKTEVIAYAARLGLEVGADMVKIKYNNDFEGLKWIIANTGKTKVAISGGNKLNTKSFLQQAEDIKKAGAVGMLVGRNVWQHEEPLKLAKALRSILIDNKSVKEALQWMK